MDLSSSSPDDIINLYNTTLTTVLNTLAPEQTNKATFQRSSPWFTDDLHRMKTHGRKLERLWRKDALTFREHQTAYTAALKAARSAYYSAIIDNGKGNARTLFSTINCLLNPTNTGPQAASPELRNCSLLLSLRPRSQTSEPIL